MQEIMQYIYGALWMLVAAILVFRFARESKWFYLAGAWFAAFSILTVVNQILGGTLLEGTLRWIFQGVSAVVSVILIIVFFSESRRSKKSQEALDEPGDLQEDGFSHEGETDVLQGDEGWQDDTEDAQPEARYDLPGEPNEQYKNGNSDDNIY